ncbi:MAG: MBL fold metallo-hydrolase [Desulfobulbaceae bacterium]|jgi:glyoxylase-like metal-dependent hydrolase (beta-lactamase superfamily II)|nr:MBL fold metallo-hydrolase [Desulfobulbaceae bacterium]
MTDSIIDYKNNIFAIDAHYWRPLRAALHFIVENGRAAIIDAGSNDSLPYVLRALNQLGLTPEAVDYVILTHVHLDHAGGAGLLMRHLPNARLVVHPRGARHMIDPAKLVAGATLVYGAEAMRRLYGEILPVPKERLIEAPHETIINLAGRELLCLDTPGHAKHHITIVDRQSASVFTGDVFGVSYRDLDTDGRQFVFPTTSPVQFDPEAAHASIGLICSLAPKVVYQTHFSELRDVPAQAEHLRRMIDAHAAIARRAGSLDPAERLKGIRADLTRLLLDEAGRFGCRLEPEQILAVWRTDINMNAKGLAVWIDKRNS